MFCPKCGNEMQDGTKFCGKCGNAVQIRTVEKSAEKQNQRVDGKEDLLIKKIVVFLGVGMLLVVFGCCLSIRIPKIHYTYNEDSTATVSGYGGKGGTVVIPEKVKKGSTVYTVTSIGDKAFYGCARVTDVEILASLTSIGDSAFAGCSSLSGVEIPDSVTTIGNEAFKDCENLTSVQMPNGVTTIGDSAFAGCSNLSGVEIPSSVTRIGNCTFEGCSSLSSVEIPSSVTSIGDSAFARCGSLTSVDIPSSNPNIASNAFDSSVKINYAKSTQSPTPNQSSTPNQNTQRYTRKDFKSDKAYQEYLMWGDTSGLK